MNTVFYRNNHIYKSYSYEKCVSFFPFQLIKKKIELNLKKNTNFIKWPTIKYLIKALM